MRLKTNKNFLESEIMPQADCPRCGATFSVNLDSFNNEDKSENSITDYKSIKCSNCDYELETEEFLPTLSENVQVISAVSAAKTIFIFDAAFFIFAAKLAVIWLLSRSLANFGEFAVVLRFVIIVASLVWYLPIVFVINWFISYGEIETDDAEFINAKKGLQMSFAMWITANLLNILVLNFGGWFNL
jgi:transcription elongation factor Elf1